MALRPPALLILAALLLSNLYSNQAAAEAPQILPGLKSSGSILRDVDGIPHIIARNEHDLIFLQGWAHARDRLFQMDVSRRTASGTLAELLGGPALGSDVLLRSLGLRRAAERSLPVQPEATRAGLEAYAAGINAYVAAHPLPPEYGPLERSFEPWDPVDTLAVGKLLSLQLSFDLDDISRTEALMAYQAAGVPGDFDGNALFFEDIFRSAPFDPAATVPDAGQAPPAATLAAITAARQPLSGEHLHDKTLEMARDYLARLGREPYARKALRFGDDPRGSNEWAVSGAHTASGRPLLANDPHLALNTPSTFYQNHLLAPAAGFDVIGSSFPGSPYVILGQNRKVTWGATFNPLDVTDVFQEQLVPDPDSPSGLSSLHPEGPEPVLQIPLTFFVNVIGDGVVDSLAEVPPGPGVPTDVLIMPRRNQGPIIAFDPQTGLALSVAYTGFSPTRELDAFRSFNLARGLDDFVEGLQSFDVGSENWAYADTAGNIAYFTSAEIPLREDLQAGFVAGLPPFFIRNGTGGNDWIPQETRPPDQAVAFEVLPFDEMPQIVNPPAGFFVNANNDPSGLSLDNDPLNQLRPSGGLFYLSPGYDTGIRAGRIKQLLEAQLAAGPVTAADMGAIQADTVLLDAQVFTPLILTAFDKAAGPDAPEELSLLGADPRVAEAVARLEAWDFSTPSGIAEGFDDSDLDGERQDPSSAEIENSIAATLYAVWRSRIIANTIDAALDSRGLPRAQNRREIITALRNLFDSFDQNQGVGASGIDFFPLPAEVPDPADRRDITILQSLTEALDLLSGEAFAAAFSGSGDQDDYRWGRLHRLVLDHPLGPPFDIPPAGGAFPPPLPDLAGIPTDGGFETVDASTHDLRGAGSEGFRFNSGPVRRYVGEARRFHRGFAGRSSLPGGESGVLGSPLYSNLLGPWLTNETHPLRQSLLDLLGNIAEVKVFLPLRVAGDDDDD